MIVTLTVTYRIRFTLKQRDDEHKTTKRWATEQTIALFEKLNNGSIPNDLKKKSNFTRYLTGTFDKVS
jgi:hypothetical protein